MAAPGYTQTALDRLSTGLRTTFVPDGPIPLLRVDWIEWDSGFRGSGLTVGDRIIAVAGGALSAVVDRATRDRWPGQPNEADAWRARGTRDGDALVLTVLRCTRPGVGEHQLDISGAVRADRDTLDAAGKRCFGIGGPARLARDGFGDAWAAWYERRVRDWERLLDGGPFRRGAPSASSRDELARQREAVARVALLVERYPGPFAHAVRDDHAAVLAILEGERYTLTPDDYAYREDEAELIAAVSAEGARAWASALEAHASERIDDPCAVDLVSDAHSAQVGRLLVLPPVTTSAWIPDVTGAVISWKLPSTWAFTALESPALSRLFRAQHRYRRRVVPTLGDSFALLGRIGAQVRLVAPKDTIAVAGLDIEPLAALMGDGAVQMFVALDGTDDAPAFAGEALARVTPAALPPNDASPADVLEAMIAAIYARDEATWFACFADWHFATDLGRPFYYPFYEYPESRREGDWVRARRVVLEQTYAVRVRWVGSPVVVAPDELPGIPRVERVEAELEHVGRFGDEYRAFVSIDVHRHWTLERRNGGPWRITTFQGI
ncbi:MAG: hypothetical protein MUF00_06695 [Gemmatimonadaceae bacterium]|nr:hypothetical protein [Gemmatimonadaceae bacterium]